VFDTRVFARPCVRHDPRADVDCDAGDLVAGDFTLAGMHPGPQLEPERANSTTHLRGAAGLGHQMPSPAVSISRPRKRVISLRTTA